MNTQEIFYVAGIFMLLTAVCLGILLFYYVTRYQIPLKKQQVKFLKPDELLKLFNAIKGKTENENFDIGYFTGVGELLQFYCNYFPTFFESGVKVANDLVKNWGHYEMSETGKIIFIEKDSTEQRNEAND